MKIELSIPQEYESFVCDVCGFEALIFVVMGTEEDIHSPDYYIMPEMIYGFCPDCGNEKRNEKEPWENERLTP